MCGPSFTSFLRKRTLGVPRPCSTSVSLHPCHVPPRGARLHAFSFELKSSVLCLPCLDKTRSLGLSPTRLPAYSTTWPPGHKTTWALGFKRFKAAWPYRNTDQLLAWSRTQTRPRSRGPSIAYTIIRSRSYLQSPGLRATRPPGLKLNTVAGCNREGILLRGGGVVRAKIPASYSQIVIRHVYAHHNDGESGRGEGGVRSHTNSVHG